MSMVIITSLQFEVEIKETHYIIHIILTYIHSPQWKEKLVISQKLSVNLNKDFYFLYQNRQLEQG